MELIFKYTSYFNSIVALLVGFFVLYHGYTKKQNIVFFFFTISISLYAFFFAMSIYEPNIQRSILEVKIFHIFCCFIATFMFLFVVEIIFENLFTKLWHYIPIISGGITAFFCLFGNVIVGVEPIGRLPNWTVTGSQFFIYLIHYSFFTQGTLLLLVIYLFKTEGEKKSRLKVVLIGLVIALIGAWTTFLPAWGVKIEPHGIHFIFIFQFLIAYSILKYQLLNIRVTLSKFGSILVTTFLFTILVGFIVYFLSDTKFFLTSIFLYGLIIGMFFKKIVIKLQTTAEIKWIKGKYDYVALEQSTAEKLIPLITSRDILISIATSIKATMQVSKVAVFLYSPLTGKYDYLIHSDLSDLQIVIQLDSTHELIKFFKKNKRPIYNKWTSPWLIRFLFLITQLRNLIFRTNKKISFRLIKRRQIQEQLNRKEMLSFLMQLGLPSKSVYIPIFGKEVHTNSLMGLIILGAKSSENSYTKEDLSVCGTIAFQAQLALERIPIYEALRQSNEVLERKVSDRTQALQDANWHLSELNENLIQAKQEAESANAYKSQFLAQMTHDLRTPLHVVIGILDHLKRILPQVKPMDMDKPIDIALKSAERQLSLVNNILDLSKIESGKMEIQPEWFELKDLLDGLPEQMQLLLRDKPVQFVIENKLADEETIVHADKTRLHQVLTNLLGNAAKFTEKGEIRLSINLIPMRADILVNNLKLCFEIQDSGIGLSPENQARLFTSYTQIENDLQKKHRGTGLGLSICKGFVEAHGGEISVKSELRKGSVFYFWVPFIRSDSKIQLQNSHHSSTDNNLVKQIIVDTIKSKRILIVDDDQFNLDYAGLILEGKLQYDLVLGSRAGLQKATENSYDLIFLDLCMPEMDGKELLTEIRKFNKATPIIALTADAMKGTAEEILDFGFSAYFAKPFKEAEFLEFIQKII